MHYESTALSTHQWSLDIDLRADLRTMAYNRLLKQGFKDADPEKAVYQFFNMQKRQIEPRPRRVLFSAEFSYPEAYKLALDEFVEKVERGDNSLSYMSTRMTDPGYKDTLLYDWNIHHFHLSRRLRKDGFIKRSDYEIFAYVTADEMYLIQVYRHKAEHLLSQQEMVRIIHDNWPELIERIHLKGIDGLTETVDDAMYEIARDNSCTTFADLGPGQVYGMIGGGYASDRSSTEVVRWHDIWMGRMQVFEEIIKEQVVWITEQTGSKELDVNLLWTEDADKVTMIEKNSGMILQIDMTENWLRVCKLHEVFG